MPATCPEKSLSSRTELANAIRALSMDAVQKANSGHPGAPMGMADIAEVLWNDYLSHNPANPKWPNRDRFVLSNGHGSMLLYSLLHLSGYELTIEDLQRWYSRWYAPNNATLVVVGDVDPQEIRRLAAATFGKIPAQSRQPLKAVAEPRQQGETRLRVEAPALQPYLLMGYKTPTVASAAKDEEWQPYALEILAAILDGGESARFSRELVRGSRVAASANVGYNIYARLSGMMMFEGIPGEGREVKDLEGAILAEIDKLKNELIEENELRRIITQTVAAKVYERDSVFYQAMQLGTLETVGLDWRLSESEIERLKAVTPQQVQAVAQHYLVPENLTVATLDPQPMDEQQALRQQAQPLEGAAHVH